MFTPGWATNTYFQIIAKAQKAARQKGGGTYFEKHHIQPRSIGGDNKKENLVLLTVREHFICHQLLIRMTIGRAKISMRYALSCMLKRPKGSDSGWRQLTQRQRLLARSALKGQKIGPRPAHWKKPPGPVTPTARAKLSQTCKTSEKFQAALAILHADPNINNKKSVSMRLSARAATQRKTLVTIHKNREYKKDSFCVHCENTYTKAMYTRWHGPRCKEEPCRKKAIEEAQERHKAQVLVKRKTIAKLMFAGRKKSSDHRAAISRALITRYKTKPYTRKNKPQPSV